MISRSAPVAPEPRIAGRFAPSPTGPLHLGSLVAAVGSWLFARAAGGSWIVRIEDLDSTRVVPGSADEILRALERYALTSSREPVWQSRRTSLYAEALERLRVQELAYDCACSRAELQRMATAPSMTDGAELVYPGVCRSGLPEGRSARAVRFHVPHGIIAFDDLVHGRLEENVAQQVGDFVIRRADGLFAYQLAVVVDDAEQGVTQVVRGGDLLDSTARQIALQQALGFEQPAYAHLPLVVDDSGAKLGKRHGSLPLPALDERRIGETLSLALRILGIDVAHDRPDLMLQQALQRFDVACIGRNPFRVEG
jgi:glutamyl-Q tRNA(Asp) synthetase